MPDSLLVGGAIAATVAVAGAGAAVYYSQSSKSLEDDAKNGIRNCQTSAWSEWSKCDCKTNTSTRTRTVLDPGTIGGQVCGPLTESRECIELERKQANCATGTDCAVSAWSAYSPCNCVNRFKTRTRTITTSPTGDGAMCPVLAEQVACDAAELDSQCALGGTTECKNSPAADCSACAEAKETKQYGNFCSPVCNLTTSNEWKCAVACDPALLPACDGSYQTPSCTVAANQTLGSWSCKDVCDPARKPTCASAKCCASEQCAVQIRKDDGSQVAETVQRGSWYCENPCLALPALGCKSNEDEVCVYTNAANSATSYLGHVKQCQSKCIGQPMPDLSQNEQAVCAYNGSTYLWQKESMCASLPPLTSCPDSARTAAQPVCLPKPGTDLSKTLLPSDFAYTCASPCGGEPAGCASIPGVPPMFCDKELKEWRGTCIKNDDVVACGAYPCDDDKGEVAFCDRTRGQWSSCVTTTCKPNPTTGFTCPPNTTTQAYKGVCDATTSYVFDCQPTCLAKPPASLICDVNQYAACDSASEFKYTCRPLDPNGGMCTAQKPGIDYRCLPDATGWSWKPVNPTVSSRRDYIAYIRSFNIPVFELAARNGDTGVTETIVSFDGTGAQPMWPTVGTSCDTSAVNSVKMSEVLMSGIGNPRGNLKYVNNVLTFFPRDTSKRSYYRPLATDFDRVCLLDTASKCQNGGTWRQTTPLNDSETAASPRPYSGSIAGTCVCPAGNVGPACQYNSAWCNGRGTPNADGTCSSCQNSTGTRCEFALTERCTSPGATGIISSSTSPFYTCVCDTAGGWSGPTCAVRSAAPNPPRNVTCSAPCGASNAVTYTCDRQAVNGGTTCETMANSFCTAVVTRGAACRQLSGLTYFFLHPQYDQSRSVKVTGTVVASIAGPRGSVFVARPGVNTLALLRYNTTNASTFEEATGFMYALDADGLLTLRQPNSIQYVTLDGRLETYTRCVIEVLGNDKLFPPTPSAPTQVYPGAPTVAPPSTWAYFATGAIVFNFPVGYVLTGFRVAFGTGRMRVVGVRMRPFTNILNGTPIDQMLDNNDLSAQSVSGWWEGPARDQPWIVESIGAWHYCDGMSGLAATFRVWGTNTRQWAAPAGVVGGGSCGFGSPELPTPYSAITSISLYNVRWFNSLFPVYSTKFLGLNSSRFDDVALAAAVQ